MSEPNLIHTYLILIQNYILIHTNGVSISDKLKGTI